MPFVQDAPCVRPIVLGMSVDVMWSVAWAPPFLFESGGSVQHSQSPMTAGYGAVMGHSRMSGPRRKAKSEHIGKVHEDEQNQKGPLLESKRDHSPYERMGTAPAKW